MHRVLRLAGIGVLVFAVWVSLGAQANNGRNATMYVQANAPVESGTDIGYFWYDTSANALKIATATGPVVWTTLTGGGGGGSLPSGVILPMVAGACPSGTTELSSLDGRALIGTTTANGNVGTTGGADSVTPDGTVAAPTFTGTQAAVPAHTISWPGAVPTHSGTTATFTGSALATHAHELPFQIPTTTTTRQIAAATFGTGTSRAATAVSAAGTANTTSAAVALSQAVSGGTPAGTVTITSQGTIAWPGAVPTMNTVNFTPQGTNSAPAFTGSAFDNRSQFTRAIFCQVN